jgi:hypothetical protein
MIESVHFHRGYALRLRKSKSLISYGIISYKKPRKSQKNPHPALSAAQKAVNKTLSQIRIFVEHAIGGMKRYNILVHSFRNRTEHFEDDAIGVCAGLWNFVLSY